MRFSAILFLALKLSGLHLLAATTEFYLDAGRTSNGDGTEANPWKLWSNIGWSSISNAIGSGDVNLYVSSRSFEDRAGTYTVTGTGSNGNWLRIIGDQKYNETASGTAVWSTESTGRRAHFTQSSGSGFDIPKNRQYVQLGGIIISNSVFGGINLGGSDNPTTNLHNIIITNNIVWAPQNNHGIWFGYGETDCHSIKISGNIITNSESEAIYMGHYNFPNQTITNCIVEYNTVVDCGLVGEGDIDIKPAVKGAIVRYNTHYRTSGVDNGGMSGVVIAADFCEVYGNRFYSADVKADASWGNNIYINDAGDAVTFGQAITSCKIYNNLLYGADQNGIRVISGALGSDPQSISGLEIYNNTIYGNTSHGIRLQVSAGSTMSVVVSNNISSHNTGYDFYIDTATGLTLAADYNLYYRASGNSWYRGGAITSFANWQALGYDANGVNADPLYNDASSGDFSIPISSPASSAGATIEDVAIDFAGLSRPQGVAYAIGAFEFVEATPPTISTNNAGSGRVAGFRNLRMQ